MGLPRASVSQSTQQEVAAVAQAPMPYYGAVPYYGPPAAYPPGQLPVYAAPGQTYAGPVPVVIEDQQKESPQPIEQVRPSKEGKDKSNFRGPLDAKRSCTDILCLFFFIIVLVGFIGVTLYGLFFGNPFVLFMGHDSDSQQMCGIGGNSDKMNLFSFDFISCVASDESTAAYLTKGCDPSMCVKECPNVEWNWLDHADKKLQEVPDVHVFCRDDKKQLDQTVKYNVEASLCPPYLFPSESIFFRCEPTFILKNDSDMIAKVSKEYADKNGKPLQPEKAVENLIKAHTSLPLISDSLYALQQTWPIILIFTGITMVISFIWIVLMRFVGPFLIWFSSVVIVVGSIATCVFSWLIYDAMNRGDTFVLGVIPIQDIDYLPKDFWLAIGILTSISSLILLFLFCAVFNRIRLAAAIVAESSKAISGSIAALFWPVVPFCLQISVHILFVLGMFFFLTTTSTGDQNINTETFTKNITNMWPVFVLLLFAWFWIINFILGLSYTTLAGSFSSWYWNNGTQHAETWQLFSSLWRAVRYHLGSIAFGALIIAIIQTIRAIMQFLQRQFKKMKNPVGVLMLKCLICCIWCVEKIMKFITKNAYIMVALKGKNFCYSARKAFALIVENAVRIVVLDTVSSVLIGISVFIIVGGVGVTALFVLYPSLVGWTWTTELVQPVNNFYVPLIVIVISSLVAALCFFSVYKMAIDTIFLNIMYDIKYNDGTAEKPYRAKKSLLNIVGKKNKKAEEKEAE